MNNTTLATALILLFTTIAVAAAGGDGEGAEVLGPVNVFDYLARGDYMERTSSAQFLRESWLPYLEASLPKTTEEYFELLKTVKREPAIDMQSEVIPLSFRIDPSLQDLSPFLSAHGLPIEKGFNDSRTLFFIRDGEVKFAPTEPGFLDTIRYLHDLWNEHVIDEGIQTGARINIEHVFGITNPKNLVGPDPATSTVLQSQLIWDETNSENSWRPYLLVPENFASHSDVSKLWSKFPIPEGWTHVDRLSSDPTTNPVHTNGTGVPFDPVIANRYLAVFNFSGWQDKTEEEKTLVPFIDELISQSVTRWITQGGVDSDWDQFQRDLDSLGLPTLIQLWQSNVDSAYAELR